MDVDEDVAVDRLANACAVGLPRLEDRVAVREHDGSRGAAKMCEHIERMCVQTVGERVVEEVPREIEQPRIGALLLPPLLHRPQVVPVAELDEAPFLDRPVALAGLGSVRPGEVLVEVVADPVVVEQRVVDIDEDCDRVTGAHPDILSHQPS